MDMRRTLRAGHGLSLLLVAHVSGGNRHSLLLDGGPDASLWRDNADRLGLQGSDLDALVLSHWHPDHSIGLSAVARWASDARARVSGGQDKDVQAASPSKLPANNLSLQSPEGGDTSTIGVGYPERECGRDPRSSSTSSLMSSLLIDLHPDRPARRGFKMPDNTCVPFNEVSPHPFQIASSAAMRMIMALTQDVKMDDLKLPGCIVQLHREAHTLCDSHFFVSGRIPRLVESDHVEMPG